MSTNIPEILTVYEGERQHSLLKPQQNMAQKFDGKSAEMAAFKAALGITKLLFSDNDEDTTSRDAYLLSISNKFSELLLRIGQIRAVLDEIQEKLNIIESKIDEIPFRNAMLEIRAQQDLIFDDFSYWTTTDDDAARNAAFSVRSDLMENIRILLRSGKNSYAYSLSIAFLFELTLSYLLKVDDSAVRNSVKRMLQYLDDVVSPNVSGSIGDVNHTAKKAIATLKEWEANLVRSANLGSRTDYVATQWNWSSCVVDDVVTIQGSLEEGLRRFSTQINSRDCRSGRWPGGVRAVPIIRPVDRLVEMKLATSQLVSQQQLNANVQVYNEQKRLLEETDDIIAGIKIIRRLVAAYIDKLPD